MRWIIIDIYIFVKNCTLKNIIIYLVVLLQFSQATYGRQANLHIKINDNINQSANIIHIKLSGELSTINLGVNYAGIPPNFNQGIAKLEWGYNGTLVNDFIIYRRIDLADWTIIANVTNNLYTDTIEDGLCNVYIDYKIETTDNIGDLIISNIEGKVFTETRLPKKPIFDSVSIMNNNKVILGWDASTSTDVMGTVIYRWEQNWVTIDTVFGDINTFTYDDSYSPCDENYLYAIAAIDSCGNTCPKTEETAQRPILIYEPEYNLCSKTISFTWEHYLYDSVQFKKYEIWSKINNGTFELIDTVPATQNYYNHVGVDNSTYYSYYVRAVFGELNFTSTSCTKTIKTGTFIKPDSLYLANADVLIDNSIELTIDVDLKPNVCTWEIIRSDADGGSPTVLTSILRNEINSSPIIYNDTTANGSTGFYIYSVNVYDSCSALSIESNSMKTIFLQGEKISNIENKLSWNSFEGFDGDIDKYYIFRILGDVIPTIPLDSVDYQTNEYIDDISVVDDSESIFSYWVQASEKDSNTYGYKEKSNSNIISFFKEITFYLPNAFRPDGINNIFKPVAIGFGGSNYVFQIYNRWGQLIFESTEYDKGWDGSYNGSQSPQGTYVYRLVYQNVLGVNKKQNGTVTLID